MNEMRVWKKSMDTFTVSSETTAGKCYRVRGTEESGFWVCSCPFFTNRMVDTCKHIERVKDALFKDEVTDETEVGKLRQELQKLLRKAGEIDDRLKDIEEGWKPSSGG